MLKIQKFDHQTIEDRRILFFDGLLIKLNTNAFLESKLIYAPKNENFITPLPIKMRTSLEHLNIFQINNKYLKTYLQ